MCGCTFVYVVIHLCTFLNYFTVFALLMEPTASLQMRVISITCLSAA